MISKYPPTDRISNLIDPKDFEEYRQTMTDSWLEYETWSKFFALFQELFLSSKKPALLRLFENENSDYVDDAFGAKNSYLSFGVGWGNGSENVLYSFVAKDTCNNILNSVEVSTNSENIYMSSCIRQSYNIFYSRFITDSSDIWFSSNLIWCNNCVLCNNLQNQSYCINNIQLEKEEFVRQKQGLLSKKTDFIKFYRDKKVWGINFASQNVSGSFIIKSENIENGQVVYQTKNWRNLCFVGGSEWDENMFDIALWWSIRVNNAYASLVFGVNSQNIYFSHHVVKSSNIYYGYSLESCSHCLGCIWLKNKSFCILNKQYTKEERFKKANEIFAQMEKDWQLGKFFPPSMNPFYFNDTVAYLIDDSFTKEEVETEWYLRRDEEIKVDIPEWAEIVYSHKVEGQKSIEDFQWFDSDWNRQINPEILKKVIQDEKWNYYRIVPMELAFLQKHWLPLPEVHRLDRIKLGFKFK